MASAKSIDAFKWACEYLFDRGQVFLWTFTFKETMADWQVGPATALLFRDIGRMFCGNIGGVRVYEVHPGGHGLHVHALLNRWVPAAAVWRIARKHGLGRVDVVRCKSQGASAYLAKYLSKSAASLYPGTRRWQSWGNAKHVRVRSVTYETSDLNALRLMLGGKRVSLCELSAYSKKAKSLGFVDSAGHPWSNPGEPNKGN